MKLWDIMLGNLYMCLESIKNNFKNRENMFSEGIKNTFFGNKGKISGRNNKNSIFEDTGRFILKKAGKLFKMKSEISDRKGKKEPDLEIQAFLEGTTTSLKEVPDQIFSKKILGSGIAIIPSGETLMAPVDGIVAAAMSKTRHSCCIRADKGLEVLLHIGVDTLEMDGDGFELLVSNGQKVKAGDPLIRFSLKKIREADHPAISSMIITEMGEYHKASFYTGSEVGKGDVIAELFLK